MMHFFPHTFPLRHNSPMLLGEKESIVGSLLRMRAYHMVGLNCETQPRVFIFIFLSFLYYPDDNHYYNPICSNNNQL